MFVIVTLSDSDEKIKKRKVPAFICERTDIDLHRYFFTVTVKTKKGKYDKKSLDRFVGNLRNSVIFPDTLPTENKKLSLRRLLNSAPLFLKEYSVSKPFKRICICDTEGFGADLTEKLVPFSSAIHIICSRRECYREAQEILLKKYGVSLTVSQKWNKSNDASDLVITPLLTDIPRTFGGLIFTCDTKNIHPSRLCTARGIELPFHLERLRPPCTDRLLFATYLYEKCSVYEIENCPFENIDISRG